jgi:hypothetical protein
MVQLQMKPKPRLYAPRRADLSWMCCIVVLVALTAAVSKHIINAKTNARGSFMGSQGIR